MKHGPVDGIPPFRAARVNTASLIALAVLVGAILLSVFAISGGQTPVKASGAENAARVSPAEAVETVLDAVQKRVRAGDHEQGAVLLEEATRSYPDQQSLRLALAECYVALNRPADAYDQYVAALSIGPRDAATEFAAGTMARICMKFELAMEHYAAAQSADMANPTYALYLAQMQRRMNQIEECKVSLLRVVKLQPENAIAWGTLADIALNENKLDLATQHIARARELEPRVGTWRLIEARILKRQSKPEQALLVLNGLSDAERGELHNVRLIAECSAMLGDQDGAVAAVVKASDGNPMSHELALEAATWLHNSGDDERARQYAIRARTLGNEHAESLLAQIEKE